VTDLTDANRQHRKEKKPTAIAQHETRKEVVAVQQQPQVQREGHKRPAKVTHGSSSSKKHDDRSSHRDRKNKKKSNRKNKHKKHQIDKQHRRVTKTH
jgi:hypothetical protein